MDKTELKNSLLSYLTTGLVAGSACGILSSLSSDPKVILGGTLAISFAPTMVKLAMSSPRLTSVAKATKDFIKNKIDQISEEAEKAHIKKLLSPYIECALQDGFFAIQQDKKWLVREDFGKVVSMTEEEFSNFKFKVASHNGNLSTLELTPNRHDGYIIDAKMTRYKAGKIQGMTDDSPGVILCRGNKTSKRFFLDSVDVTDILTGHIVRLCDMLPTNSNYDELYSVLSSRDQEACAVSFAGENFLYFKTPDASYFDIISRDKFSEYKDELDQTSIPINFMSVSPIGVGRDTIGVQRTVMGQLEGDTIDNPAIIAYVSGQGHKVQYWSQGEQVELNQKKYGV